MAKLIIAPQAEGDVLEIAIYLAEVDVDVADRFIDAAYDAFSMLAVHPGLGRERRFQNLKNRGVRSWRVKDFERYLIFYVAGPNCVEIRRVLHGARDLDAVFSDPKTSK